MQIAVYQLIVDREIIFDDIGLILPLDFGGFYRLESLFAVLPLVIYPYNNVQQNR